MIRVLPPEIANRIAAGEVIERPASVVKELVENSLDAGARRIRVEIEDGGGKLIRVTDDGVGMAADDLGRCILPHATSKISDVSDLFRVTTLGFRGEALPSIGSVARLTITSRPKSAPIGARIVVDGGRAQAVEPAGAPLGTCVEVANLFFNVPARKQFLKQDRAEVAQVIEVLTRLALPDPAWTLELVNNGRRSVSATEVTDRRERIASFFGEDVAARLLGCEAHRGDAHLVGFISPVDLVRPTARQQYLFLNGRAIRDRKLSYAITEAYRGLIMPKDHPIAFLFLTVDPGEVDVNVHPAKAEVRFRDADKLFGLVTGALRRALDGAAGSHGVRLRESAAATDAGAPMVAREGATQMSSAWSSETPLVRPFASLPRRAPADAAPVEALPVRTPQLFHGIAPEPAPSGRFLQVHRSYVVVEVGDGIRIFDQHALHERKLFDELLERFRASDGEDQLLLVPHVVDVSAADRERILPWAADLARLGLRIEAFGTSAIALRSVPAALRRVDPARAIEAALEVLTSGATVDRDALLHDVIATVACKAAVKFSDALPDAEVRALIAYEREHPEARNCPHGRNTSLLLSLKDLETQFQRKK